MNKQQGKLLTNKELTFILFGSVVGVGIISLPNDIAKIAYEDSWISIIIGGIYPLYMMLMSNYMKNKFPSENILVLSKKYFGKVIGSILNIVFGAYFIFLTASVISGYSNAIRLFIVEGLSNFTVCFIISLLALYASMKGLKTVGKIGVVIFYITIIIFISPFPAIRLGTIKNIMPLFKVGVKPVLKASMNTVFAYAGLESIFVIYPNLKEKNKMLSASLQAIVLIILLYTWVTFVTTVYLGSDIVSKSYYSFLYVTESVTISVVNNFRYIFMLLWGVSVYKAISTDYFISASIFNDVISKISIKKIGLIVFPIVLFIAMQQGNMAKRNYIVDKIMKFFILYNLFYVTLVAIFIMLKKGENCEKEKS